MTEAEINQIAREIEEAMLGRTFGAVFPLSSTSLAIDFQPHAGSYLFVDFATLTRAVFLIVRKLKELERSFAHASPIVITIRKLLSGRELTDVRSDGEAINLCLKAIDQSIIFLHIQIRRDSPNILLTDERGQILVSAREIDHKGRKLPNGSSRRCQI